jgi:hypothetical protein
MLHVCNAVSDLCDSNRALDSPISLPAALKLLIAQLEERLPNKTTAHIVDGRYKLSFASNLLLEQVEGLLHARLVGDICADTNGMSAAIVDLVDNGLVILGLAC